MTTRGRNRAVGRTSRGWPRRGWNSSGSTVRRLRKVRASRGTGDRDLRGELVGPLCRLITTIGLIVERFKTHGCSTSGVDLSPHHVFDIGAAHSGCVVVLPMGAWSFCRYLGGRSADTFVVVLPTPSWAICRYLRGRSADVPAGLVGPIFPAQQCGEAGARGLALAQRGPEAREARRAFEWREAPGRASPLPKPWTFRTGAWNPDGDRLLRLG